MRVDHDRRLTAYAELAVRIALNLQPGQRLLVIGPLMTGGVALEAAPLVRRIADRAYHAGAELVEAIWGDEDLLLARFEPASQSTLQQFSAWLPSALTAHVEAGHAILSVYANDPDLLQNRPADLVALAQQTTSRAVRMFRDEISRNRTNWAVIAAPSARWAARVFPELPAGEQVPQLSEVIERLCRLDQVDPLAAWEAHLEALATRRDHLNARRYTTLRYAGPGTRLTVGLPEGHIWMSGRSTSAAGIPFTANLPTEEVFTMPHKDRVEGVVRSSRPLSHGGSLIDRFMFRFVDGRIVEATADRGQEVLRQLLDTDPGAARLGEVALVPQSSPVARSGLLFYNTLFDENAASHLAIGAAYKFTLARGEEMEEEAFAQAGGNRSATHVDFMIGSPELDVDGVLADGSIEPIMRGGEWVADVLARAGS